MKPFYFTKFVIPIVILLGLSLSAIAQTTTFNWNGSSPGTGSVQTYTVPTGVTALAIDARGGGGGFPYYNCGTTVNSSNGGRVTCNLAVTPGQVLYIYVGSRGQDDGCNGAGGAQVFGGFNGGQNSQFYGGASGGASDIRLTPGTVGSTVPYQVTPYTSTNRIVVAGGAGGGADYYGTGGPGGGLIGGTGIVGTFGGTPGGGGTQTGSGSGGSTTGSLGLGGTAASYGPGGGGYWGGNGGTTYAGGGGGSSYTDPTLCTSVVHTQGYSGASGNGQVIITVLCTAPGTIVGATPVCPGSTITLTNPTGAPGGTWTTSSPSIATISPTGVVTGVAPGTTTITYVESNPCGGVNATATVTVLPLPGAITGTPSACVGLSTSLADGGTGTWVSSNPSVATVSPSGVVTGITAGTSLISYTLSTGCAPATQMVTIYPTPAAIGGSLNVCASGAITTLTDALGGGSWTSGTPATATIGAGSGVVTGLVPGTSLITYTSANGCVISSTVTVNPLPAAIGGVANVCVGSTTTLTDATGGGTWTSNNTAQATIGIGSGTATGITAGTPTITYTLATTGCRVTTPLIVNPLPSGISGSSNLCVGSSTTLTDGGGGTWTSSDPTVATINTFSGSATGVGPGTATITYTLVTGCSTTSTLLVNPLPTPYTLTGGGSFCAGGLGSHVGMTYASSGVNYTLYLGGVAVSLPNPGSNSGLDFGLQTSAGVYTVVATNAITGCSSNMTGSVTISVNALPATHNITGGGGYCVGTAGSPLGTDASDVGINYQLYNGAAPVGPIFAGTGSALSFGSYTAIGTYTVLATNPLTGCSQLQGSNAVITVSAAPTLYSVTGGGSYCAGTSGSDIGLGGSDGGTLYQLYHGGTAVGAPQPGGGGSIDFGFYTVAGTYTVIATNLSGCTGGMTGSATVVINPLPAVNSVTGGGSYCAGSPGLHVGLSFSTPGINYSLIFDGGGSIATTGGSGSSLDFGVQTVAGTYTVIAINGTTLCSSNMSGSASITVNLLPDNSIMVLGGGSFCAGGTGSDISTSSSEGGVNYQLYRGTTAVGLPVGGTGLPVDFGMFTTTGTYTVKGTNAITGCSATLTGSEDITVNPLPGLHNVTGGGNFCAGGAGEDVVLNGSSSGISYELIMSGSIVNTLSGTGASIDFGMQMAPGTYTVLAIDSISGCQRNMLGSAVINVNPLPAAQIVTGGGSLCAGGTGWHIGLLGSTSGIAYQLYNGLTPSGSAVSGGGSTVDFGIKTTAGTYTVMAINPLTGCTALMTGSALINVNSLPNLQVLTGGGNYCAGGPGENINLINSDLGVNYQLYRYGIAVMPAVGGVSGPVSFGLDTFGVYTAKATDTTTGCTATMLGSVTVNTVSPVVYTVTVAGSGSYCAGGAGVLVNQTGSTMGVSYQLISAGSPVGTALAGTGLPLSYGLLTAGTYSVQATDTTLGCIADMAGNPTITVNSLPVAEPVNGGGSFCAGGSGAHVGLINSVTGVNYQLFNGGTMVGAVVPGTTGSALDFGLETTAGSYTATAVTVATGCTNLMSGSATITIKPTPTQYAVTIDNSGNYCAGDTGVHVGLANSQTGVTYQLFRGTTTIGSTMSGTGSALTLALETVGGSYTVVALDPTSTCTSNMLGSVNVNIIPLPNVHNVTGGGGICPSSAGLAVGLDGSDAGMYYQLYNGTTPVTGAALYGTGSTLSFGLQATAGAYTVQATNEIPPSLGCANNMFGTANIYYDTLPLPNVTIESFPGAGLGVSQVDSIKVLVTNGGLNPTFQWYVNGHAVPGATTATLIGQSYFNDDSVSCTVTGSGPCGGLTTSKSVIIKLQGVSVKQVSATGSDIRLIPNPNKGAFSLKGTLGTATDEELTVEITNVIGQVIYSGKIQSVNGSIDQQITLGNTPANGMYLLNLSSGNERTVFHFVIEQ